MFVYYFQYARIYQTIIWLIESRTVYIVQFMNRFYIFHTNTLQNTIIENHNHRNANVKYVFYDSGSVLIFSYNTLMFHYIKVSPYAHPSIFVGKFACVQINPLEKVSQFFHRFIVFSFQLLNFRRSGWVIRAIFYGQHITWTWGQATQLKTSILRAPEWEVKAIIYQDFFMMGRQRDDLRLFIHRYGVKLLLISFYERFKNAWNTKN